MGTYIGTEGSNSIGPDGIGVGVVTNPLGSMPGAGSDTLIGNGGDDFLDGGEGADTLVGGSGNDRYFVDDPGDIVTENDTTDAGGEDVVYTTISFTLSAGVENLGMEGSTPTDGTGNELDNGMRGNFGDNVLKGLAGNDSLIGGVGSDTLDGAGGGDTLRGGTDDDILAGAGGADTIKGNKGKDTVDGGKGTDTLAGGGGNDEFMFAKPGQAGDLIKDFKNQSGNNDKIVIGAAGFKGGLEVGQLSNDQFQTAEHHQARSAEVRFIFDTRDETLWFDRNGSEDGGLTLVADLQASANLQANDIWLI